MGTFDFFRSDAGKRSVVLSSAKQVRKRISELLDDTVFDTPNNAENAVVTVPISLRWRADVMLTN